MYQHVLFLVPGVRHTRSYVPQYGDELPMIRPERHCASRQRSRLGVISHTVFPYMEKVRQDRYKLSIKSWVQILHASPAPSLSIPKYHPCSPGQTADRRSE